MEQRNVIGFNFVRRQSETSLHCINQDQNANVKTNVRTPVHRSVTFTPRDISRVPGITSRITLPERFRRKIRRKNSASHISSPSVGNGLMDIDEEIRFDNDLDWEDRKSDMERAIKWVKQELLNIREQDRVLVKRFLDLQTAIQHTHGIRSCPSLAARSNSSLSSSSWLSLDDGSLSAPGDTPVHQRDILLDLQHRAQVNYKHLMRQSSADVSSKYHSVDDLQARAVSLMNVSLENAEIEENEYDTLKTSGDSLTESEDESNYDTLTKYPTKSKTLSVLAIQTDSETNGVVTGDDSNYETLAKSSENESESGDDTNYDTLTKYPRSEKITNEMEDTFSTQADNHAENLSDFDTDSLELSPGVCEDSNLDTHL